MRRILPLIIVGAVCLFGEASADSLVICANKKTARLIARTTCRSGEKRLLTSGELRGTNGTNGTNGADGIDGSLRIYGDGSSGPLSISTDTDWTVSPPTSGINYYTDVTVAAGATLRVPSGYVFRCTGSFNVSGSVIVAPSPSFTVFGQGGSELGGNPGISLLPPENQKQVVGFTGFVVAKRGGRGLQRKVSAANLRPGLVHAGATSIAHETGNNAGGGGAMFVLAKSDIVIKPGGSISADGANGSIGTGGGGGGVVVLASANAARNFGTISSRGGRGSAPANSIRKNADTWFTDSGSGGGGGGGVIHFVSPSINGGVTNVLGGTGGPSGIVGGAGNTVTTGGGGGGSYGDGGNSGTISVSVASTGVSLDAVESSPGLDGTSGIVIETPVDPTFSF